MRTASCVLGSSRVSRRADVAFPLLDDQRIAGLDRRQLAYQVLLRIPVGTVAWEEIAFRGVLQAAGAGALLSRLRERSGSLAAPVLLHLAANCTAPLASALARPRMRDPSPAGPD